MKTFREIYEAVVSHTDLASKQKKDAAYFIFGRMHPPTAGHDYLIKLAKEYADKNNADFYVFLSPSEKGDKNPVPYKARLSAFKNNPTYTDINVVENDRITTPQHAAGYLHNVLKYPIISIISGSDRKADNEETFKTPMRDGTKVNVISLGGERAMSGEIDPSNVSTVKGSKVRALAKAGDYKAFRSSLPPNTSEEDAKALFDILKNAK
jgi:hypothetical protein